MPVRDITDLTHKLCYPMCGGKLTNRCMWSGQASASMIITTFCQHNYISISQMSFLNIPNISFSLNFECDVLLISSFLCFYGKRALNKSTRRPSNIALPIQLIFLR